MQLVPVNFPLPEVCDTAPKADRQLSVFCRYTERKRTVICSVTKDQSGWGFTVKQDATTPMKTVQPVRSQPPAWQWRWKQSPMPSAGLPQEVTVGPHTPSSSQIQWTWYKQWQVEWEALAGMCRWSTLSFENSCVCTALDMLQWREMVEQTDWRVNQLSQATCVSEDLKCWGAWDIACGHKTKDITPTVAWMREARKEEALTIFLERTREGHRQSDEHWNCFKGNIGETSERWGGAHMGFSERIDIISSWTELNGISALRQLLHWVIAVSSFGIVCPSA